MFEISTSAMTLLKDALESEADPTGVFRLVFAGDSVAIQMSPPEEGDVIYEQGGMRVVAASPELVEKLGDQVLDVEETEQGRKLVLAG